MGYHRAGFEVVGVDIKPQPHYPFKFLCWDALEFMDRHNINDDFSVVHASPPCQAFTRARKLQGNSHPDFIKPLRGRFDRLTIPWIIENVPGSPLNCRVVLCGTMFGLPIYRHRIFETRFPIDMGLFSHPEHQAKNAKMGRPPKPGEFIQPVGHFSGVKQAQEAMGIDWMGRNELREAIPPAYTEFIGKQLMEYLNK